MKCSRMSELSFDLVFLLQNTTFSHLFDSIAPEYQTATSTQPPSTWNLHFGFSKNSNDSYPEHTHDIGLQSSLMIVLKEMKYNLDALCSGGSQGFIISAHVPNERPQMFKRYFYMPMEQTVLLTVDPLLVQTDDEVLAYDLSVRQCYKNEERKLRFYKQYTIHNCRLECLTNFTLSRCGCVKYSMPRSQGTKICGPGKLDCYRNADGDAFKTLGLPRCNCLQSCTFIKYMGRLSQTAYNFKQTTLSYKHKFDEKKYAPIE